MEIISIFQSLNRGDRTIVLITHDQEVARYTNRTIRLERGRVAADENVRESKVALAQEAL